MASSDYAALRSAIKSAKSVVALAGAGLSAASGIPTFRGAGGLWRTHDAMSLATPDAFARDPALVWDFYHYRRSVARSATPNAAHHALAKLSPTLITQNVDGLSATVGHTRLLEMHGTIRTARCARCGTTTETFPSEGIPPCPRSGCAGVLRPNVVWFGEMPQHLDEIDRLLKAADVFLVVGTSSTVYPAAGFAAQVKRYGRGKVAVFNLESSPGDEDADSVFTGPCEETLPKLLEGGGAV